MKLGDLAGGDAIVPQGAESIAISGITADSRKVGPGFLFAALSGSRADGMQYAADAASRGAAAILGPKGAIAGNARTINIPVIEAAEPRAALSRIAARFHPRQPGTMVAVTGTAGKTSVASFTRQIWEMEGRNAASIGTTGVSAPGREEYGSLTTPDPVDLHRLLDELAGEGVTHAAMEASSHGLDQHRLDGVRLSAAAFTNLGRDHMDYHPTVEHYFNAKMRLFSELLPKDAPAIIFADDEWSAKAIEAARRAGRRVLTVGRHGDYIALKRVEHERFCQSAEIAFGDEIYLVDFPLAGDFQIANGLVAAGLAIATGSAPDKVFSALARIRGAKGRLELVGSTPTGAPVYVDYAHKPEAMAQVLSSLRPFTTGRLIIVFGCGGDRDPGKRPIMGGIAARLADTVIVTDDNPRSEEPAAIRAAIMAACPTGIEIGDRRSAIFEGVSMLRAGDALVIAGKGHEEGQIMGEVTHPFSDHSVAREALASGASRR
jgi:UDP-N-acetylmuramoyl-L-alanyl-D-glutamate--2,6-diaminopimelate ligase